MIRRRRRERSPSAGPDAVWVRINEPAWLNSSSRQLSARIIDVICASDSAIAAGSPSAITRVELPRQRERQLTQALLIGLRDGPKWRDVRRLTWRPHEQDPVGLRDEQ